MWYLYSLQFLNALLVDDKALSLAPRVLQVAPVRLLRLPAVQVEWNREDVLCGAPVTPQESVDARRQAHRRLAKEVDELVCQLIVARDELVDCLEWDGREQHLIEAGANRRRVREKGLVKKVDGAEHAQVVAAILHAHHLEVVRIELDRAAQNKDHV